VAAAFSGLTATSDVVSITVLADFDRDGIPDALDPDDDNDGMPDVWETAHGLNPFDAADAVGNADTDVLLNGSEYVAATDPNDGSSFFSVEILPGRTPVTVSFMTRTGRVYGVEYSAGLSDPPSWQPLTNGIPGTGGVVTVEDPTGADARFYRARVRLP
jgi:hypothetical protein